MGLFVLIAFHEPRPVNENETFTDIIELGGCFGLWVIPARILNQPTLGQRGVGFCSLTDAIDTTTPGRRLVFHIFGALGQFERDLIGERTRAGLAVDAARGRKGGRKPIITDDKLK